MTEHEPAPSVRFSLANPLDLRTALEESSIEFLSISSSRAVAIFRKEVLLLQTPDSTLIQADQLEITRYPSYSSPSREAPTPSELITQFLRRLLPNHHDSLTITEENTSQ